MPNSFFQFKRFIIQQDRCAMKVSTDACLFGAWIANKIENDKAVHSILDIGCGTGLLSIMIAQKSTGCIDAIEIDEAAFLQAKENITASPWSEKISAGNISLQQFVPGKKYELIICNPPFFEDDLKSPDEKTNAAKHDTTLTLKELVNFINRNLITGGKAAILLPYHRIQYFKNLLQENKLFISELLFTRHSVKHAISRAFILFTNEPRNNFTSSEMFLYNDSGKYTEAFCRLLQDYYLGM